MPICHTWPKNLKHEGSQGTKEAGREAVHIYKHRRTHVRVSCSGPHVHAHRSIEESTARRPLEVEAMQTQLLWFTVPPANSPASPQSEYKMFPFLPETSAKATCTEPEALKALTVCRAFTVLGDYYLFTSVPRLSFWPAGDTIQK